MANIKRIVRLIEFYIHFWKQQSELYQVIGLSIIAITIYFYTLNLYFSIMVLSPGLLFIYHLYNSDKYLKENYFYKVHNINIIERVHMRLFLLYIIAILIISFLLIATKLIQLKVNIYFSRLYYYSSFLFIISLNLHKVKMKILKWMIFFISIMIGIILTLHISLVAGFITLVSLILTTILLNKNEYINKF